MKYAILLARQRSGTGALGTVLDKHPELKYLGEVFHPGNLGQEQNYFTFLRQKAAADPEAALPDRQYETFLEFLDRMNELFGGRTLIVDIKYRSLHHLNGGWQGPSDRPRAIAEVIKRGAPILHLTRRNALRSFLSGRLAEANRIWHARPDQEIAVTSTVLNIRQLSHYIVSAEQDTDLVRGWTRNYAHLECFDYDEMFDDAGQLASPLTERLARLLGTAPFADRAPGFAKQAPTSLEAAIENYPLVRQALTGGDAGWMLD